MLINALI